MLLWIVLVILLLGYGGGVGLHLGGNLIHILLVLAVVVLLYQVIVGRRGPQL